MTDHLSSHPMPSSPIEALQRLVIGHQRFRTGTVVERDAKAEVARTSSAQHPFAAVLACMDSRVTPERIFDQGLGDLMCVRVAGHVVSDDVIGSLEFACEVAGTQLLVVLGHTRCGAVTLACAGAPSGNLDAVAREIQPAVDATPVDAARGPSDDAYITAVARKHVELSLTRIRRESALLNSLEQRGTLLLAGALYDVSIGALEFLA
jgi:carbonic anhydrase